ncbi:MAG: hypothetical protein GY774_04950 [Planctomycetes bacterium]|nr:hypothetical protein [Planctomycetota bacterium]
MTLKEILAKIKEALEGGKVYDPESDIQGLVNTAVSAVNAKNTELLSKMTALKKEASDLPEGFTVEKWLEYVQLEKDFEAGKLKGDEQLELVRTQMKEQHEAEMKKSGAEKSRLESALHEQLIDNALSTAIVGSDGNALLLLPHMQSSLKVVEENGKYKAIVVDAAGNNRLSMVKHGEHMDIPELVGEFKKNELFASAFKATSSGGGGGGGDETLKNPFVRGESYSLTEQSRLANSNPELAKQMSDAAAQI